MPMPDDRRERDRYRRASLREQWADELRAFLGSTPLVLLVAALVGGWLLLEVTKPQPILVSEIRPGDCLYIRASDADTDMGGGRPIGTEGEAVRALFERSVERAPCDASHSHEVADAWALDAPAGAPYPGGTVLREAHRTRCEAAFERHVGRPVAGSALALTAGVPTERAWDAGSRSVVCLVSNGDGSFLSAAAAGSRR